VLPSSNPAYRSFFAGAVPLSITLSQSQLRLVSSIGIGILVGTSLIVIIPEGIETIAASVESPHAHEHGARSVSAAPLWGGATVTNTAMGAEAPEIRWRAEEEGNAAVDDFVHRLSDMQRTHQRPARDATDEEAQEGESAGQDQPAEEGPLPPPEDLPAAPPPPSTHRDMPTFDIGLSLVLGFGLMFLIDRLPRHATERFRAQHVRHMSLDSIGLNDALSDAEGEGDSFLGSLAPSPRRARSLATTVGLVIHAVTDGIAMGASSTAADTKLGVIVFIAIMIHKAPVSFGLTSVLLSHGLSKRVARGHLIVFSLAAPAGALTTWFVVRVLGGTSLEGEAGQWWTGMLLLFSAGTFL
jgi:zinc transporter 9